MKKTPNLVVIAIFLLASLTTLAKDRIAIQDALILSEAMKEDTIIIEKLGLASTPRKILEYYSGIKNASSSDTLEKHFNSNPFLKNYKIKIGTSSQSPINYTKANPLNGFSWNNLIVGYVDFVIERANEEMNIAFFKKLRKRLDEDPSFAEFRVLFPTTTLYLTTLFNPIYFSKDIDVLREKFLEDLKNIKNNYIGIFETPRMLAILDTFPSLKNGVDLAKLVPGILDNSVRADSILEIYSKKELKNLENDKTNITSVLKITGIISESLRASQSGETWASKNDFEKLFKDDIALQIYVGLIYQQIKDIPICYRVDLDKDIKKSLDSASIYIASNSTITKKKEKNKLYNVIEEIGRLDDNCECKPIDSFIDTANISKVIFSFRTTLKQFSRTSQNISSIIEETKNLKSSLAGALDAEKEELKKQIFSKQVEFTGQVLKVFETGSTILPLFSDEEKAQEISKKVSAITGIVNGSLNIPRHIYDQAWGMVIVDVVEILESSQIDLFGSNMKILRYGTFAANIVMAESSDEVEEAIKSTVLPSGSASIKKNAKFNLAIQTYIGSFYAREHRINTTIEQTINDSTITLKGDKKTNNLGISLPLGLAFSVGSKREHSFSFFTSVLDFGAVANFRLNGGEEELLPKFKIENFLAPGVHIFWGFPKVPLSLGAGWQFGPLVRNIEASTTTNIDGVEQTITNTIRSKGWRVGVSLVVDIPLFNIYNNPRD